MAQQVENLQPGEIITADDYGPEYYIKALAQQDKFVEIIAALNALFIAGEDTATIKGQVEDLQTAIELVRDETQAISTGSLNYIPRNIDFEIATGDRILCESPLMEIRFNTFESTIAKGQWGTLVNVSGNTIFAKSTATLSFQGRTGIVSGGDRLAIKPFSIRHFYAVSPSILRVY